MKRHKSHSRKATRNAKHQRKNGPITPRNARQVEIQERALATISLMRREHLPLKLAARVERIRPATVLRYAGAALRKSRGDYRVKPSDSIPRSLNVLGPRGMRQVSVRSSRKASQIARYMNAVKTFVRTGKRSQLKEFQGKRVTRGGQKFIVSPAKLKRLADPGALEIDKLYSRAKGS
jgi:hypothetical protein